MLKIKNISKTYSTQSGVKVKALEKISLSFNESGLVFICGKSGSGKTTLINILSGLDEPNRYNEKNSEFKILDRDYYSMQESDMDAYRNSYVGYVFQEFGLINELDVEENIALAIALQNDKSSFRTVSEVLEMVGLENHEKRKVYELSGGQKQRVSIARALIKNPRILFADEPTGNLDSETSRQIFSLLKELSKTMLIVIVTHETESAINYGDRIITLSGGKVFSDKEKTKEIDLKELKREYQKKIDEHFENSKENEYNPKKFIKTNSKMSLKTALRLCLKSIKAKKTRFIFTIMLTTIALTVFIISDFMNRYDYHTATLQSMARHEINTVMIRGSSTNISDTGAVVRSPADLNWRNREFLETLDVPVFQSRITNVSIHSYRGLTINRIRRLVEMHEEITHDNLSDFYNATLIVGELPQIRDGDRVEVLISEYLAENFMRRGANFHNGFVDVHYPLVDGFENLLGANFLVRDIFFYISGIFATSCRARADARGHRNYASLAFNRMYIYNTMIAPAFSHLPVFAMIRSIPVLTTFISLSGDRRQDTILLENINEGQVLARTFMSDELIEVEETFSLLGSILTGTSLLLFLLAMLLVFNFISSSVSSKKSDIGILRAMGAKNKDTAKILIFDGTIVLLASIILAIILSLVGVPILNLALSSSFTMRLNIISYNFISFLLGILTTIATVAIAFLISFYRISRLKAIDASRRKD
ncbi:MAG: ABC transporter ATP-binding protein/permease [Firmicutes bacterium]|nr:ABC transporter ATP-binding protein/permease [Bacillota bacterium]